MRREIDWCLYERYMVQRALNRMPAIVPDAGRFSLRIDGVLVQSSVEEIERRIEAAENGRAFVAIGKKCPGRSMAPVAGRHLPVPTVLLEVA